MPTIWRRWRRWYASRRSSSAFVRPHVHMLFINTGTTKDSYNRSRNGRLIRDRLNHTVDILRNATFASCFRRATSSASASNDPSLRVMRHSSSTRSACRQTLDRSVLDALMASDHSDRQPGYRIPDANFDGGRTNSISVVFWKIALDSHYIESPLSPCKRVRHQAQ